MSFRDNQGGARFSGEYRPYRGRGGFRGRGRGGGDFNGRRRSPSPDDLPSNGFRRGGGGGSRYHGGGGSGDGFVSRRRSYSPRPQNDNGDSMSYRPRGGSRGGGRGGGFYRGSDRGGGYVSQREYRRPYDDHVVSYPQRGSSRGNGHFRSPGMMFRNDRQDFDDGRNAPRRRQYSPGPMNIMRNGSPPPMKFDRRDFMGAPRDRYSPPPMSHRLPMERSFEPRFVPRGGGRGGGERRYYSPEPEHSRGGGRGGRGGGFRHQSSSGGHDFGAPRAPRFEDRRRGPPQDLPPRFNRNADLGGPPPFKRSRPGPGGPVPSFKRRGSSPVSP